MSAAADTDAGPLQPLAQHVDALIATVHELLALLAREHALLDARADAQMLEQIAGEKHAAIERASTRYALLRAALGLRHGSEQHLADGVAALRPGDAALAARVQQLLELTRSCKQANQDNGVLISAGLRSAGQALHTLHGAASGPTAAGTYGPAGHGAGYRQGNRFTLTA